MLKCSRSSAGRCNNSMRKSSSPSSSYERQRKPVMQSVQLRRLEGKQRPEPRKRPRDRGLRRRRKGRRGQWNIFSDSGTRC